MVQWLKFYAQDTGGLGLIPGQGTSSHMPQLRLYAAKLKKKKSDEKIQTDFEEKCPTPLEMHTQTQRHTHRISWGIIPESFPAF